MVLMVAVTTYQSGLNLYFWATGYSGMEDPNCPETLVWIGTSIPAYGGFRIFNIIMFSISCLQALLVIIMASLKALGMKVNFGKMTRPSAVSPGQDAKIPKKTFGELLVMRIEVMRAGLDNKKGKTDEEDKEGTPAVNKGVAGLALHPLFVPVVTTLIMIAVMSTYIAVLEMTLKVNDMKGVDEVNSTGQLLALLLGGFTCFKALLSMVETLRGGGNDAGGEKGGDVEK